jgi:hypothetical protein
MALIAQAEIAIQSCEEIARLKRNPVWRLKKNG